MSTPKWVNSPGFLGTTTEHSAFSVELAITNPTSTATFKLLSGSLPNGLKLKNTGSTGTITGIPFSTNVAMDVPFVIRAFNSDGITDRPFYITTTGSTPPVWITPNGLDTPTPPDYVETPGILNAGLHGQSHVINKSHVDFQFTATSSIHAAQITYTESAGSQTIFPLRGLPPGLSLSPSGRLYGIVNDTTFKRPVDVHKYAFDVTANDGFSSSTASFIIRLVSTDIFGADSSTGPFSAGVITADRTYYNAEGSSFIMPEWVDSYNLGTVRSNDHQVIQVSNYDPYPTQGITLYDWVNAGINPVLVGVSYSTSTSVKVVGTPINNPAGHVGFQTNNREGDSQIYLRTVTQFPEVGQVFRLDPYVRNADSTEYEITSVSRFGEGCRIRFAIRTSATTLHAATLPVRILDSVNMVFGTRSNRPTNFKLDVDSGSIYGTFPYQESYSKSYDFTVRILKINTIIDPVRYRGVWSAGTYYRPNDVARVETLLDYEHGTLRVINAEYLMSLTNVTLGTVAVTEDTQHIWKYTSKGPINGFVDLGIASVIGKGTGYYTYYRSTA